MTNLIKKATYAATIRKDADGWFIVTFLYNFHGDTRDATVSKITSYKTEKTANTQAKKWVDARAAS